MTASDELRRRAGKHDKVAAALTGDHVGRAFVEREAAELRALADLVEACIWPGDEEVPAQCAICGWHGGRHTDDCKLAAVERAFKEQGK